jgi:hypothetical protein
MMNDCESAAAEQTESTPALQEHPVAKHMRLLREQRAATITASIPADTPDGVRAAYEDTTTRIVAMLGRRRLACVAWPWLREPQEQRVRRGNPRRNPTALL